MRGSAGFDFAFLVNPSCLRRTDSPPRGKFGAEAGAPQGETKSGTTFSQSRQHFIIDRCLIVLVAALQIDRNWRVLDHAGNFWDDNVGVLDFLEGTDSVDPTGPLRAWEVRSGRFSQFVGFFRPLAGTPSNVSGISTIRDFFCSRSTRPMMH